jgi:formylglycine-generating enzyme required for sulfatase activity
LRLLPQPSGTSQPPQPVSTAGAGSSAGTVSSRWRAARVPLLTVLVLLLGCVLVYTFTRSSRGMTTPLAKVSSPAVAARVGDAWTNSIGMELAYVPAGGFLMGSPGEQGLADEHPMHRSQLSQAVLMGVTEVTQWQYQAVMKDKSSPSFFAGKSDHPVEQVSWNEAAEFCRKLSDKEGMGYRLPTEAEWEHACRAGTTEVDGGVSHLDQMAWYGMTSSNKSHAVGMLRANAWGFRDMHGNVWEWCADTYGPYVQGDQADPIAPAAETRRVARGGSWYADANRCSAASRWPLAPDTRLNDLGFRVVLEIPGKRDR